MRVFVRIEKLDRIPGVLGVEIVRSRIDGANVTALREPVAIGDPDLDPLLVFMPNSVLQGVELGDWLTAISRHSQPAIICVEQTGLEIPVTGVSAIDLRLALLSMEQNALVLAAKDSRCIVASSRTELDWALKNGQLAVWAPSKIVLDAVEKPDVDGADARALARWFAGIISADTVCVLGEDTPSKGANLRSVPTPSAL